MSRLHVHVARSARMLVRRGRVAVAALLVVTGALPASAADLSASAFGTIGYARSNEPFGYQRFIDDSGTIKRDSVAGLQVDAKINDDFAATVQVKAAAATSSDRRYEASVSWAFLSYRPSNDWLFRVGKQRIPLYLFSENYDVGATYDFLRLPTEMYSLVPSNDAIGASFSKVWKIGAGELSLDGYAGTSSNEIRYWFRDAIPGVQDSGASFYKLKFRGGGLVASYKVADDTFRLSAHRAIIRPSDGSSLNADYPFVTIAPGLGYYQVSSSLPGPGVATAKSVINTTVTVGADVALPFDFRVVGEFARSLVPDSSVAPKGNRGYAALLKRFGSWTPYVTYAFLRSPQGQRDFYTALDENALPAFIPGASSINAAQRSGADSVLVYHQSSWALGASYAFSATSKLKGELLRTRIGDVSKLVDGLPGSTPRNQDVNVFSLSYSVVY